MATIVGEAQLTRVGPERPRPTGLAVLAPATASTSLDSLGSVHHPIWEFREFRVSAWAVCGQLPPAHVGRRGRLVLQIPVG